MQVGHQFGHLTVIQAEDSVQEPNTALQLIELTNVKGHTLEFKLKNSGSDSAFLTGIRFVFKPAIVSNSGCSPVPVTDYDFVLQGRAQAQTVTIHPSFEKGRGLYLNVKRKDTSWSVVPLNRKEPLAKADESIEQGQETVSLADWRDLHDNVVLEEIFSKFTSKQYQPEKDKVVVYFVSARSLFSDLEIVRVVTKASQRLPLSQVVPPRGVDRFQVVFSLSDKYFGTCAEAFDFNGYGILEYDKGQELRTPPFNLSFVSRWLKR